ncbi:Bgt-20586 [Blumeria graminis f. sp. tritici]|uniref:Bgt-20586 n=2 Tax=Blumeria graminis f. sp. tritici TaxID=62690 RepID=A0A381LGX4_BLUGR|nr:Bgt-20586 [Blumeria graminis f. sp. tritici]
MRHVLSHKQSILLHEYPPKTPFNPFACVTISKPNNARILRWIAQTILDS